MHLTRKIFYALIVVALFCSLGWTSQAAGFAAAPTLTATRSALPSATPTPGPIQPLTAQIDSGITVDGLAPDQPLLIHFSRPMDPASAKMPVLTSPFLAGKFTWSDSNQTLTFAPEGGFQPDTTYQVYLDPNLAGKDGALPDPATHWTLRTLQSPRLLKITPPGGVLHTRQPTLQLAFENEMDADSVAKALTVEPVVPYRLSWRGRLLEIELSQPLELGQHYQFGLAESSKDVQGVSLGADVRWDYWVDPFAVSVSQVKVVSFDLHFNYPLDPVASQVTFKIQPELPGNWTWVDSSTVRFFAEDYLAAIPTYTVSFTGSFKGMDGDDYPLPDPVSVAPLSSVREYGPAASTDVSLVDAYSDVWITFNRSIDRKSVEAAFSITPKVVGTFQWYDDRLLFKPSEAFVAGSSITARLDKTALDALGQPLLVDPLAWTFNIERDWDSAYEQDITFGQYGANAQVLNAGGRRAIQFMNGNSQQKPAIFTLYRIETGKFAALYRDGFGLSNYWQEKKFIDTAPLQKMDTWPERADGHIDETLLSPDLPPGAYLLTLSSETQQVDQLMVVITDNRLVLKRSGERIWVWATDFKGNNVKDLHVRLYTEDGALMREGDTDADGLFETSLPKDSKPMLVTAISQDGDMTVAGVSSAWQGDIGVGSYWWEGCYYCAPQPARFYRGYIYTERPIYQPGQTVYFKAVVRGDDDIHFALPKTGLPVTVRLLDARGNEVQRQELALNAMGALNGSFLLGDGAMLGDYTIEATVEGETFQVIFAVQDYRKPDYQVAASLAANAFVVGDEVKVEVDTQYFFGYPVANASVHADVYGLIGGNSYQWWQDVDFQTGPLKAGDYTWGNKLQSLRTATTDANGRVTFTFNASMSDYGYYTCRSSWSNQLKECYLGIEITAEDGSGQSVSTSKAVRVYNSGIKYSLDAGNWLKRPGVEFNAAITAVDIHGEPAADKDVQLVVRGYTGSWTQVEVSSFTGKTGADGKLVVPITIEQDGYYELEMTELAYRDGTNHQSSDWVYVSGTARKWDANTYGEFKVEAERKQYKPYEKARLMITSPFDGPALITYERGQVIHSQAVMLTAPLTLVEVDIIPEYAPNVFVKVNAWKGNYQTLAEVLADQQDFYEVSNIKDAFLYSSEVELAVDAGANRLNVTIEPDQASYLPGSEANLKVRVTDAQSQPVQAEFSLALVDEAIYSLAEDRSGAIFEAFYGRRIHNVITYNTMALNRYLLYDVRAGGGGGADFLAPGPNPRSNFQDTAIWLPEIRTDADGIARVTVTLPDNLTSWRVVVKAITAATQVGEGQINILTQKDLVVRPVLPQELVVGDTFSLTAMLHNYADRARRLEVTLQADGLQLEDEAVVSLSLPSGQVLPVTWRVTALEAGELRVTIHAEDTLGGEDAIQLPLVVRQRAIPEVVSQSGDFLGEWTGVLVVPPELLAGSSAELRLSRSIGGSMMEGLEYLTGYPYGCVEQTMSRALPNAVVGRALSKLDLDQAGLAQDLPTLVNAGLQRLYGYQHNDGGWGWWYDDATNIYQTAWVVFGLAVTREAGYPVEADVIERGAKYLQDQLADGERMDVRTRAYLLYSLARAGYGQRDETLALMEQLYALDPFSQAGLALALHSLGETDRAAQVLAVLDERALRDGERAYWLADRLDGNYYDKTMSSSIRTTALGLSAYLQIAPDHVRIPQLVRYLMSQRQAEGWGSTNETAFTLLALTDYLLLTQQQEGEIAYQVFVNDQTLESGILAPGAPALALSLPIEQLRAGPNRVKVTQTGAGRLYYTLTGSFIQDLPSVEPTGTIDVTRTYRDAKTGFEIHNVQAGQLVRVELKVRGNGDPLSYMLIEDHLPGGLEAINEQLNNVSHDANYKQIDDYWGDWRPVDFFQWQKFGYNNKEIRDGRVSFFVTTLDTAEEVTFTYLARATQTGVFTALPAEVSAMYKPAVWGHSGSAVMEVR